jgi:peptidase M28-like protein
MRAARCSISIWAMATTSLRSSSGPDRRRTIAQVFLGLAIVHGCASKNPPATSAPPAAPPTSAARPAAGAAPPLQSPAPAVISESSIRAHLEFLASDALNGRGSGTRDEWLAATYVAAHFRAWGLEPMGDGGGFVQTIEVGSAQATAPPVLTAGNTKLTHGREMLVATLTAAKVSGQLWKYQPNAPVPDGAVVLMPAGARPTAAGAACILAPETAEQRSQWATRGGSMPTISPRPTKLITGPSTRSAIVYLDTASHAAISALPNGAEVSLSADLKVSPSGSTWNTVGRLTGSDPTLARDVIVLSAHLDHLGARPAVPGTDTIYNGADDDASGTVAVMMLAEAIAKGPRPKRTIMFALFGSEERGGYGAAYFVDLPVVPLSQIVTDLQFEMLARPDPMVPPHTLWLTGYPLSNLGAELASHGARLVADPHLSENFFMRSDNIRFARRGVVAHTVSSYNLHQEYHQPSDEVRLVDFAHMTDAITSLLEPIRALANSTFRPSWAPNGCPAPCR